MAARTGHGVARSLEPLDLWRRGLVGNDGIEGERPGLHALRPVHALDQRARACRITTLEAWTQRTRGRPGLGGVSSRAIEPTRAESSRDRAEATRRHRGGATPDVRARRQLDV